MKFWSRLEFGIKKIFSIIKSSCIDRDYLKSYSEVFNQILDVFLTYWIVTSEELNFVFVKLVKIFNNKNFLYFLLWCTLRQSI